MWIIVPTFWNPNGENCCSLPNLPLSLSLSLKNCAPPSLMTLFLSTCYKDANRYVYTVSYYTFRRLEWGLLYVPPLYRLALIFLPLFDKKKYCQCFMLMIFCHLMACSRFKSMQRERTRHPAHQVKIAVLMRAQKRTKPVPPQANIKLVIMLYAYQLYTFTSCLSFTEDHFKCSIVKS